MNAIDVLVIPALDIGGCCDGDDCCGGDEADAGEIVEGATCALPWETQIAVLRARVSAVMSPASAVREVDLWALDPDRRDKAVAALQAGAILPLVFVGTAIVCTGTIDVQAVVEAVSLG